MPISRPSRIDDFGARTVLERPHNRVLCAGLRLAALGPVNGLIVSTEAGKKPAGLVLPNLYSVRRFLEHASKYS
jgi:hypothetical protein